MLVGAGKVRWKYTYRGKDVCFGFWIAANGFAERTVKNWKQRLSEEGSSISSPALKDAAVYKLKPGRPVSKEARFAQRWVHDIVDQTKEPMPNQENTFKLPDFSLSDFYEKYKITLETVQVRGWFSASLDPLLVCLHARLSSTSSCSFHLYPRRLFGRP